MHSEPLMPSVIVVMSHTGRVRTKSYQSDFPKKQNRPMQYRQDFFYNVTLDAMNEESPVTFPPYHFRSWVYLTSLQAHWHFQNAKKSTRIRAW